MFNSNYHSIVLGAFLTIILYGSSYFLFVANGDVYQETPTTTLKNIGCVTCTTNAVGFVLLRITQRLSRHHLNGPNHTLSQSYQCRENMCVVQLISPVYILLFITRLCQFGFRIYVFYIGFKLGAFTMRLFAHTYNLSLALSVLLTPTLLILLQPKLAGIFIKKKESPRLNDGNQANGAAYFDELRRMWT
ncbi:unnamed protein product [Cylicocyclus nassatus]|uniref:Uncharacterized protein n=1 Tax=Cylicocyclus nassatus TaxID=53992 RepID=A0AA36GY43_CYLNA|nr:unnamed protein product [Cylicocyclus nassatus]